MQLVSLNTERLILRPWKQDDLIPLDQLCVVPQLMAYFLYPLSFEESQTLIS